MTTVHMKHLLAVVGLVTLSLLVLMALILPAANPTWARADETLNAPSKLSATNPISIPLVHPVVPIGSSQPGTTQSSGQPPTHTNSINAIPFRPQVRLQRGAVPPDFQLNTAKPARQARKRKGRSIHRRPSTPYQPSEANRVLSAQGWSVLGSGRFRDGRSLRACGTCTIMAPMDTTRTWGTTDYLSWGGNRSAWPAAGGTDALDPCDILVHRQPEQLDGVRPGRLERHVRCLRQVSSCITTPSQIMTKVYFCISIDALQLQLDDSWSGYSMAGPTTHYWLTSYAGYPQVWFAWVFYKRLPVTSKTMMAHMSMISTSGAMTHLRPRQSKAAPWMANLSRTAALRRATANNWNISSGPYQRAASNLSLQPESNKRSVLPGAQSKASQPGPDTVESVNSVVITNAAPAEGTYHALMSWSGSPARDSLYQQFYMSPTVSNVTVNYWYGVTTDETVPGYDFFCASLQTPGGSYLVDLGCMDAVDTDDVLARVRIHPLRD